MKNAELAAEVTLDCTSVRCLSEADFSDAPVRGVYVSSVPSAAVCEIRCGTRRIRAGDVLPVEALAITGGEVQRWWR